mmetsp:Transcript_10274/g.30471  ORF Transcript_10274/g.30471 Transcript_10274/m.30471 type:complete len:450 (-) Transcript_10274:41-1390(-)
MGGGEGNAEARAEEHHEHGAELDCKAAGRGDLGELDANGVHDLVAVNAEAHHDAKATDGEDPVHVVANVVLLGEDALVLVDEVHCGVRTHGVGHIVGAVCEGVEGGGEDLHVAEDNLRLAGELLSLVVDVTHNSVLGNESVGVSLESVANVAEEALRLVLVGSGELRLHFLGLGGLLLGLVHELGLRLDVAAEANRGESHKGTGANADNDGDPEVITARVPADGLLLALRALDEHVHERHGHGEPHEDGVRVERAHGRVLVAEHKGAGHPVDERSEAGRKHGREHPGHDDGADALDVEGLVLEAAPAHALGAHDDHGHANHATNSRVRGGHGELEVGGEEEPEAGAQAHGGHAPHERARLVDEAVLVGDALADGVGHMTAEEHRAGKLKDGRDHHGVADAQGLGAHGGGEGVRDVVGADAKRREEGEERGQDDHPLVIGDGVHGCRPRG